MKKYNVAILGIRGAVGQCMYRIVKERKFPVNKLILISPSGAGGELDGIKYVPLTKDVFNGVDIVLSSPGAEISKIWAPIAAKAGAVVIDNTSQFRMDKDVPLVVPEVNPEDAFKHYGIIANPNCSTIQMVVVLKPLHDAFGIKRVVVSTYQSVTGAGKKGVNQLEDEIAKVPLREKKFPHPIAFNILPHIDVFLPDGYTKEEQKMTLETKKIMGADIPVTATTVRVPVFGGHSEAVNIEFEQPCTPEEVRTILNRAPSIIVEDDPSKNLYQMPINAYGKNEVFVGRIRKDFSIANGINLWIVSDNIRKGAATNAVQIAELLASRMK